MHRSLPPEFGFIPEQATGKVNTGRVADSRKRYRYLSVWEEE
jgi:hypothetical protein